MRVLICGGPRSGKTTLAAVIAAQLGCAPRSTDELIPTHDWSEVSDEVARWFTGTSSPWVIEGVAVPRALRKWFAAHPGEPPADRVIWLDEPKVPLTGKQAAMRQACFTVMRQVIQPLRDCGLELEQR